MHVVATEQASVGPEAFVGVALTVVFADGEEIAEVRRAGEGTVRLAPPFHVSDEDAYLLLPDDIGVEIIDILRDGDSELLHEAMRDGLLVVGGIERRGRGHVELEVDRCWVAAEALRAGLPYAAEISMTEDIVREINTLDHVQCTIVSALVDDEGLDAMLREEEYIGTSWRVPAAAPAQLRDIDPTFAWSTRTKDGRVGIELALFLESDEMVAFVRPVIIDPR